MYQGIYNARIFDKRFLRSRISMACEIRINYEVDRYLLDTSLLRSIWAMFLFQKIVDVYRDTFTNFAEIEYLTAFVMVLVKMDGFNLQRS